MPLLSTLLLYLRDASLLTILLLYLPGAQGAARQEPRGRCGSRERDQDHDRVAAPRHRARAG